MAELFALRPARDEDLPIIDAYAYREGMDNMPSAERITVAVSGAGDVVGFIRIALGAGGMAHVNPIVTCASWRGYGVGRALIEQALETYGELRLVARGSSVPFYRALGFEDLNWEDIDMAVCDDCEGCPMRSECAPQPMGRAR